MLGAQLLKKSTQAHQIQLFVLTASEALSAKQEHVFSSPSICGQYRIVAHAWEHKLQSTFLCCSYKGGRKLQAHELKTAPWKTQPRLEVWGTVSKLMNSRTSGLTPLMPTRKPAQDTKTVAFHLQEALQGMDIHQDSKQLTTDNLFRWQALSLCRTVECV